MRQPGPFEEGQGIDIADGEAMAHVKGGACSIGSDVVGVQEGGIRAIRGIVDGMAVRIRNAHGQIADGALRGGLEGMVDGVSLVLELRERAKTRESGTERVSTVAAGDPQIWQRCGRYSSAAAERGTRGEAVGVSCKVCAISRYDGCACSVRIATRRYW